MAWKLDRRTFLRGVGGVAIGLPLLETMLESERARAADPTIPKRYLVCFAGTSLGGGDDPLHNDLAPDKVGTDYDIKSAIQPFADYDVASEISIVSGLRIPCAEGGSVPAGGKPDNYHAYMLSPLFSGMRSSVGQIACAGPTSDQIVAAAIAENTTFPSLVFRVQVSSYVVGFSVGSDGIMSYKQDGGDILPIPATVSPKQAFDSLFYNFTVPDDPALAAAQERRWRMRKSVIDLVRGNTERLVNRLGGADKQRIERHYDEIRDLEKRINALPPVAKGACQALGDPGEDPAVGGDQAYENGGTQYDVNLGYSGEEERARVFCDLVHMAFTCDMSRVGTLMFTCQQSALNMNPLIGLNGDLHGLGHYAVGGEQTMNVSKGIAWHMKHYAYLIDKLRSTPEGDGTLLDSAAAAFLFEGGHGHDFESGNENTPHSTENMIALLAGRAGGLQHGTHIVADGMHPANVLVSAMNAVGVPTSALGEVEGGIPGLLA